MARLLTSTMAKSGSHNRIELISCLPNDAAHPTPLLFVHGAWHAAWCWERFLPYFARHGYAAHAMSFRGHGASTGRSELRWYSAARHYLADLAEVVESLPAPPVLIGHSLGGYVVQKYLETHHAPAAVLLAPIPVSGALACGLRFMRERPWPFFKAHVLFDSWHLVGSPELAQRTFFSFRTPLEEVAPFIAQLQSESLVVEIETALLNLPRPRRVSTPMLVLAAAEDWLFTPQEAAATARAYHADFACFPQMGHDMMLEPGWQQVADTIVCWLQR